MLWPKPMNIKLHPGVVASLFNAVEQCTTEQAEIDNFPRHGSELSPAQRTKLEAIAVRIVKSQSLHAPISAVLTLGFADIDLSVQAGPNRTKKELEVSQARADNGMALLKEILGKTPGGPTPAAMMEMKAKGRGATDLVVPNPTTEPERRKNRRVVFQWVRCVMPEPPPIHPHPHVPHDLPKLEDDLSINFATDEYQVKILWGNTAGEVGAKFQYRLAFWDVKNKRLAEYNYSGVCMDFSLGVPWSTTSEQDWKDLILTKPLPLDMLEANVTHDGADSVLGSKIAMKITFMRHVESHPFVWNTGPSSSTLIGIQSGRDTMTFVTGSVKKYSGGPVPFVAPKPLENNQGS